MRSYKLSEIGEVELGSLITRPRFLSLIQELARVEFLVDHVRQHGDVLVKMCTCQIYKTKLDKIVLTLSQLPDPHLDSRAQEDFDFAYNNIYKFHAAQFIREANVEITKGVQCKRLARSFDSVGLHVLGGTAVLPSTVLMLAVPAQVAGCKTIVLAIPPAMDGTICKEVLYCAKKAGVTHILKTGGSLAISTMASGTETCPKVDKIFCRGSKGVKDVKMMLPKALVSVDITAVPSEVLVIVDKHAIPRHVAADLLSQAEHGPGSQLVLVVAGEGVDVNAIEEELSKQCQSLPKGEFAAKALSNAFTVFTDDMFESIRFSNLYVPQHLIVNVKDAETWEHLIENAGSVFLGPWTPGIVGDYASGTDHVLPSHCYARMYGGVSLDSFLKYITVQSLTEDGLRNHGPYLATMAELDGFDAHKLSVTLRLEDMEAKPEATFDRNS